MDDLLVFLLFTLRMISDAVGQCVNVHLKMEMCSIDTACPSMCQVCVWSKSNGLLRKSVISLAPRLLHSLWLIFGLRNLYKPKEATFKCLSLTKTVTHNLALNIHIRLHTCYLSTVHLKDVKAIYRLRQSQIALLHPHAHCSSGVLTRVLLMLDQVARLGGT